MVVLRGAIVQIVLVVVNAPRSICMEPFDVLTLVVIRAAVLSAWNAGAEGFAWCRHRIRDNGNAVRVLLECFAEGNAWKGQHHFLVVGHGDSTGFAQQKPASILPAARRVEFPHRHKPGCWVYDEILAPARTTTIKLLERFAHRS